MAVAKTIKVNLTLDDQGFITKVQDANGKITALKQTFAQAGRAAEGMENNLGKIRDASKNASLAVSSFSKSFEGAKASITKLAESARDMRKDLNSIAANTEAVTDKFRGLAQSAGAVERNFRNITVSSGRLAGDLVKLDVVAKSASKLIRQMGSDARAVASDMQTLKTSVASMNSSTSSIEAAVRRANAAITDFTQHMLRMNQVSAATARTQTVVARSVEETGMSFHNWIWTLGMAREAAFTLFDVFLRAPIAIIQTNAELERMQKLFEGMSDKQTRSERQADGVAAKNKIMDMSLTMPFDVKTLTDAAVKLKSGGIDPLNGSLKTLGDAVAYFGGTSDQFHRAAIAIQQMAGKGVISMEELRQQLGEAVPTAMQSMATAMGYTMAELTDKVSKGQVEAKSALSKMLAQMELEMGGAGERMMQTWSGMWEGFKSRMVMFQEQIGKTGFFEQMRAQLSGVLDAMDKGKLQGIADSIGDGLSKVVSELNDLLTRAGPLLDVLVNGLRMVGAAAGVAWDAFKELVSALSAIERTTGLVSAAMYAWISMSIAGKVGDMVSAVVRLGTANAATAAQTTVLTTAQNAANASTAAGAANAALLTGRMATLSGAATAAGAGMAAFGRGLLTLAVTGGPIMILTTAIGVAIGKMIEWAKTAEETTNRVRLAAGGQAQGWKNGDEWKRDYDDLKESQQKTLDAHRKYLSDLDELRKAERAYGADDNYTRNVRARVEESKKAYQDLAASHERLKLAYKNNNIKTYTDKDADRVRSLQLRYDAGEEDYRNRMVDRQAKFKQSDAFKSMDDRQRAQALTKIEAESSAAYINALTGLLNKTKDAAERKIIEDKIRKIKAQTTNYQTQLLAPNNLIAGKKKGSEATIQDDKNPLDDALEKARADAAMAKLDFEALATDMGAVTKAQQEATLAVQKMFMGGSMDKGVLIKEGETKNRVLSMEERIAAFKKYGAELVKVKAEELSYAAQAKVMQSADKAAAQAALDLAAAKHEADDALGKKDTIEQFTEAMRKQAEESQLAGKKLDEFNAKVRRAAQDMATAAAIREAAKLKREREDGEDGRITDLGQRVEAQRKREIGRLKQERDQTVAKYQRDGVSASEIAAYESEMNAKIARTSEEYAGKAKGALGELLKSWEDVSGQMGQVAANFTSGFADELTNLVTTGKGNFAELAESMVKQIIKINLQLMISKFLMQSMGMSGSLSSMPNLLPPNAFAKGGAFASAGIQAFASGGAFTNKIASVPTVAPMALFGEAGPEAIMPLGRAANGELGVRVVGGGGNTSAPEISINIINQSGTDVTAKQGGSRFDGKRMILDVVMEAVTTPGSFRETMKGALA